MPKAAPVGEAGIAKKKNKDCLGRRNPASVENAKVGADPWAMPGLAIRADFLSVVGEVLEDFDGVPLGAHQRPDGLDFACFSNEEGAADDTHESATHEDLFLPGAKGLDGLVGGIAQQREIQLVLGFERRLRLDGVGAHAQDGDLELIELFSCVAKLGRLNGSTRSVGLGIKKQ